MANHLADADASLRLALQEIETDADWAESFSSALLVLNQADLLRRRLIGYLASSTGDRELILDVEHSEAVG